jgi:CRISPR-associated endonuclease/helicase Cas3
LSAKPVRIEPMPALAPGRLSGRQIGEAAEEIAEAVLTLLRNRRSVSADNAPATVGCIVNTVRLALAVAAQIRARGDEGDPVNVVTLVGRMRPHELHGLRAQHPDLFTLRGDKAVDVVVATQTLEVGVDMDFAALVTELAPGSALAQRAGRANRSGSRPDAPVIVFRPAEQPKDDVMVGPYSGDELAAAAAWLDRCSGSRLGLAPWRLHPRGEGLVPPGAADRRPVYQRVETWDVEDWERTSDDLAAEPWLDLWLADSLDPDLSVGFVVRAGLPRADLESARRQVEVTPPWVDEVFPATLTDAASILSSGRGPERVFLIRGDVVTTIDKESVGHLRLRPNDILVVDSLEGWTADGAITADSGARVDPEDVGELGAGSAKSRWARLGMETPLGRSLGAQATKDLLVAVRELLREDRPSEDTGEETIDPCEPIRELLESRPDLVDDPRVQLLSELLKWDPEIAHAADVGLGDDADSIEEYWIVVRGKDLRAIDEEALQTWVPQRRAVVDLDVHQRAVADEVAGLADRIGLSPVIRPALVHAARLHDQGKEDERFQRSLRWRPNHYEGRVLAKSGMQSRDAIREARAVSGLPRAWRHEQLSAAIAWAELASVDGATRDLATRLIGTSHGRGRHEFPHVGRTLVPQADAYAGVRELYDEGEWELVLARTSQRYGPWGCAYLEAVLRAADGEVSRRGS